MDANLRVLQLLDRYKYGGGERVALTYDHSLKQLGLDSHIFAIADARVPDIDNVILFKNYFSYIGFLFMELLRHRKLCIVCHTTRSLVLGTILKAVTLSFSSRLVFVQHLNHRYSKLKRLSWFQFGVDKVLQITPVTTERLKACFDEDKIFYFNNYIAEDTYKVQSQESELFKEIEEKRKGKQVVTFVGAVKAGKNAGHLIELADMLKNDSYLVLIVGDGPELHGIKQRAEQLALNNVIFCGFQNQPLAFLALSDVFYFSSFNDYEMMPMAVLEAKSLGCKVVAYDMPVNKVIVPEGNLFSAEDFQSIADAIKNQRLVYEDNGFDAAYGLQKWRQLFEQLYSAPQPK